MWVTKIIKYSYVDDKDKEKFLESNDDKSEDSEIPYNVRPLRRSRPEIKWNIAGSVVLILIYGLSIFATVSLTRWYDQRGNNLLRKTSAYSPVFDKVSIPLIKTKIDATLIPDPSNPAHIYRLPPSPEVDAAWDRIAHIGMHALTKK